MSPILVRPVREQLEHDRVIRQLQARWKRRFNIAVNVGMEQSASVSVGGTTLYPDLVLTSLQGGRKVQGVVEVETGESVNNMEALAQWAPMSRMRAPFYLYVPSGSVEGARRLCQDNQIEVAEIWSYHSLGDQTRFALVHRGQRAAVVSEPRPGRAAARGASQRRAATPKKARRGTPRPASRARAKAPKKPSRAQRRR